MKKLILFPIFVASYLRTFVAPARAQEIINEAIKNIITTQGTPGAGLAFYIAQLWKTIIVVGGLAFLLYTVWGGIEWMMSGGDKGKIEEARHKITNSLIGLALLVASFAITYFVGAAFKIDLLAPTFPTNY